MTPEEEEVARRMRAARDALGLSQRQVAVALRPLISPTFTTKTYSRWERREGTGFIKHISAIAEVLGTTVEDLTGAKRDIPDVDRVLQKLDHIENELRAIRGELSDPDD